MAVAIKVLNKYFMDRINRKDIGAYEVVQRYISLLQMYRRMEKQLYEDGLVVTIKNGSQSFKKAHPLINDMKNINAQLINLKKEIDRHVKEYERYRIKEDTDPDISNQDLI